VPGYDQALQCLSEAFRNGIQTVVDAWGNDADLSRIRRNILHETALAGADFVSLLERFGKELDLGAPQRECWRTACRAHQFRGRVIPSDRCPSVLGRVRTLDDHAKSIAEASGGNLTSLEAKRLLLKNSGSRSPTGFERLLRRASLGRWVIWATFDPTDGTANPFNRLPKSRVAICSALGLGGPAFYDAIVVLVWGHAESGFPPLHRPTVADAADYPYYRPHSDPTSISGFTEPLPPNLDRCSPQPEVILAEIDSRGLRLPFQVLSA